MPFMKRAGRYVLEDGGSGEGRTLTLISDGDEGVSVSIRLMDRRQKIGARGRYTISMEDGARVIRLVAEDGDAVDLIDRPG